MQFLVWVAGLVIIYGVHRNAKKPTFVHVLWALISLSESILIVCLVLRTFIGEKQTGDKTQQQEAHVLYIYYLQFKVLFYVVVAISHWIFAAKYFEMVLKVSLIFEPNPTLREKKQIRVQLITRLANLAFYLQLAVWVFFVEFYFDFKPSMDYRLDDYDKLKTFWHVFALQPLNLAVSAAVLIFSISYFHRLVPHLDIK